MIFRLFFSVFEISNSGFALLLVNLSSFDRIRFTIIHDKFHYDSELVYSPGVERFMKSLYEVNSNTYLAIKIRKMYQNYKGVPRKSELFGHLLTHIRL